MNYRITYKKGVALPLLLVFGTIFIIVSTALISYAVNVRNFSNSKVLEQSSLAIAESGTDYYTWHLNHSNNDYKDGNTSATLQAGGYYGPFIHDFKDSSGIKTGQFSLKIYPPLNGSTIVTIESTGSTLQQPNLTKISTVKVGKKSLSDFGLLSNSPVWIGNTESVSGKLHSNGGIRFDGTGNAGITSSVSTYSTDIANHGTFGTKSGIWSNTWTQSPIPTNVNDPRPLWQFPVIPIDFTGITINLSSLKTTAQNSGLYLANSGKGYEILFKSNGTFDVYKVTKTNNARKFIDYDNTSKSSFCTGASGLKCITVDEDIQNKNLVQTYSVAQKPVIFVEDNVWISGTVAGKVTLVSGNLPDNSNTNTSVIISNNLTYAARDGSNNLGIIAQRDIIIPVSAPSTLSIDGVLLAQNGHVYVRSYYNTGNVKTSLSLFGGIVTNGFWTWSYVNGTGSVINGYNNTTTTYDQKLLYSPPPYFPTTGEYDRIDFKQN